VAFYIEVDESVPLWRNMPMAKRAREILAKRLKELRAEKGWSQDELAAQAGLHRAWIGAIERAERDMRIDNLDKLAAAFRIPVKELFDG